MAISPGCSAVNGGNLDQSGSPLLANRVILGAFYPGEVMTITFSASAALPLSVVTLSTTGPLSLSTNIELPLLGTGPYSRTLTITGNGALGAEAGILALGTILGVTVNLTVRCSGVIAPTTTTVTSTANPTVVGQAASFSATVATPAGSSHVPNGNVTFNIGGTNYGPVAVNGSGIATYSTSALAPGTYPVTAAYAGNANFAASSGTLAASQTVAKANTTTTVTASATPTYGSPVTFTATTAAVAPGGGTPTGNVIFTIGGVDQSPVALSSGTATISRSNLPPGTTAVSARYVTSTNYNASSGSLSGGVTVAAAPTTTTVTQSNASSAFGEAVSFQAQVASGGGQPTGSVIFTIDGTAQSPVTLSNGSASFSTSSLGVGAHTVSAAYQATTNFAASTGTLAGGHAVTTRPTTTTLSGPGSIAFGSSATVTATVAGTGGPPTGSVIFTVDGQAQPSVALSSGTASLNLPALSVGNHTVSAAYSGAPTFAASTGTLAGGQAVTAATTTLAIAASPSSGVFGAASTFTASVTSAAGVPAGNVIFTIDGVAQSPVALAGGTASITSSSLSAGNHTVSALYEGNTNFLTSTGALASAYVVARVAPSLTVSSSANPAVLGQGVQLTANVTATSGTPSGTVTFTVDGNALPAATLSGGTATVTLPALSVGDHAVSVRYSGDTSFLERTGTLGGGQKVNPGNTSLTVSTSAASITYGTPVTVRADLAATAPASGNPSGQVVFLVDGVAQPGISISGGRAELTLQNLALGPHTISAAYQGSTDFNPSTASLAGGISVAKAATTTSLALDTPTIAFGQTARATATIAAASGAPATGQVTFTVNGTTRPAVSLQNGTAAIDLSNLAAGTYSISAAYAGSANHVASTSATSQLTVAPATTTLGVTTSAQTVRFGDPVTLSANLAAPTGTPAGSIEFLANGTSIGTATLSGGTASLSVSNLAFGNATITARYAGSANFAAATGALASSIAVTGRAPQVSVSLAPSSAPFGQDIVATISVSSPAGTPQGNVVLTVDGTEYPAQLANGTASVTLQGLAPGSHAVSAAYQGQTPFLAASSSAGSITITRADSAIALAATSTALTYGQSLALEATLSSSYGVPTGGVTFTVDGTDYPAQISGGKATVSVPGLLPGEHTVSASYAGSTTHLPSQTTLASGVAVSTATTSLAVTSSAASIVFGQTAEITVAVTSAATGPAGRIIVSVDGNDYGEATASGSTARLTLSNLTVGAHSVAVQLVPNPGFAASTAQLAGGVSVTAAPTSVAVTASGPATAGQATRFNIAVSSAAGTPGGQVIPIVDGVEQPAVSLASGRAGFDFTFATSGNHAISARYVGSESFAAGSGQLTGGIAVSGAASQIALTANPAAPVYGQSVSVNAAVTSSFGTPTGVVVFASGGVELARVPLTDGVASLTRTDLAPGSTTITATYQGDAARAGAEASLALDLANAPTAIQLTANPATLYAGAPVTLTANISSDAGSVPGSVIFVVGGSEYAAQMNGGVASVTLTDLGEGSYPISARFAGQPGFAPTEALLATNLVVEPAPADIEVYAQVPRSVAGQPLTIALTATGGVAPYSFAVTGGALPEGLTLNATTGAISGTPTTPGNYNFTIGANGAAGAPGSVAVNLTVLAPATIAIPSGIASGIYGTTYSAALAATGGTGPYLYQLTGNLPSGVTFDAATGTLAGTPTALGNFPLSLTVTDANGFTATRSYSLTIAAPSIIVSATLPEAGAFVPFEGQLSVTGGQEPYSFAATAGALPDGLSLDPETGAITGTPRVVGEASFTVTATDGNGFSASLPLTLNVKQVFAVVLPDALAGARQFRPYGQILSASGGTAPYQYALTSGALPAGLTLDGATGAISGTPTAAGNFGFTLTATDANGIAGSVAYALVVDEAATLVPDTNLAAATAGSDYAQTLSVTGGASPYTFSLVSSGLPAGITFDAGTGTLSGTPTEAGSFPLVVEISDANGDTITQSFVLSVLAPVIVLTPDLPPAAAGEPFVGTISVTGGAQPLSYTLSGTLPRGLVFDPASGAITGTPTQVGSFPITVVARDANGFEGSVATSIAVSAATTLSLATDLAALTFGQSAEITATASSPAEGLTGRVVFSLDGEDYGEAALANGVARITLSGLTVGSHSVAARIVPDEGFTPSDASLNGGITVTAASSSVAISTSSNRVAGVPVPFTVVVSSASGTPDGRVIPVIDGVDQPAVTLVDGRATFDFTFATSGNHAVSIRYSGSENFAAETAALPGGVDIAGATVDVALSASPENPTFGQPITVTANVTSALGTASGLVVFSANGVEIGTVSLAAGAASITINDLPSGPSTITAVYQGDAARAGATQALDIQLGDAAVSIDLSASANSAYAGAPLTFTAAVSSPAGSVPGSVTFLVGETEYPATIANGVASLTLTDLPEGTYTIAARYDGQPGYAAVTQALAGSINVDPAPTDIEVYASVPRSVAGEAVTIGVSATGGIGPYAFTIGEGSLPAGLTLNLTTGEISGTPTTAGTYVFTLNATGTAGAPGSVQIELLVLPATTLVVPDTASTGIYGEPLTIDLAASGGTEPYQYVLAGTLPQGMTFDASNGVLSGTPLALGSFDLSLTVTDANGFTVTRDYMITIEAPTISVTADLPEAGAFVAYQGQISATGGSEPYTFAVTSGALPPGLSLDAETGSLTGTPRAVGDYSFSISVTDANGFVTTLPVTLAVEQVFAVVLPATVADARQFRPYGQVLAASGGTAPYAYAISDGALPEGLVLDTTSGTLSGTPTQSGNFTFTLTASDANGISGSAQYTVVVAEAATLIPGNLPEPAIAGIPYSQALSINGGTGPYGFALISGALPEGLTFDENSGTISGVASADGTFPLVVQIADANGDTVTATYRITVVPPEITVAIDLPQARAGEQFEGVVTAAGGAQPFSFALSGTLPAGLSFDQTTGRITGTPTAVGSFPITITASDGNGYARSATATIDVTAETSLSLSATPSSIVFGETVEIEARIEASVGDVTGQIIVLVDGTDYARATVVNGIARLQLAGLTVGSHAIAARFEPAAGYLSASAQLADTIEVVAAPSTISIAPPQGAIVVGTPTQFAVAVSATAGTPDGQVVVTIDGTDQPAVSLMGGEASLAYTFTTSGSHSVSVRYLGSENFAAATATLAGGVTAAGAASEISLSSSADTPIYGQPVTVTAVVSSTVAPPTGQVTFSRNGVGLGTVPLTNGSASLAISSLEPGANEIVATYSGDAAHIGSQASIAVDLGDAATTLTLTASPTTLYAGAPVTFTARIASDAGAVPGSIAFQIGGIEYAAEINGGVATLTLTDLAQGNYSISAGFAGQPGFAASQASLSTQLVVEPPPTDIEAYAQPPRSVAGEPLSIAVTATGGVGPYAFTISAGALPDGVTLDAETGAISGTPNTAGSYAFTVTATGAAGQPGSVSVELTVLEPATLSVPDLAPTVYGADYSADLSATGGTAPYRYQFTGALPAGVTFDTATATLSGTPTALGDFAFTLSVTDANGFTLSRDYSLTVSAPLLELTADLPAAGAFVPYQGQMSLSGGSQPYRFTVSAGALPDGLAIDPDTGTISGTPSAVGEVSFTVTATDANGFSISLPVTIAVEQVFTVTLPATVADARQFRPYGQVVAASGGTAPYAYAITAGNLPVGISLDATSGTISGTPKSDGSYAFTLTATDANGVAGSRAYTLVVAAAATLVPNTNLPDATAGVSYDASIVVSGGAEPYAFALISGALPVGLEFDAETGTVSGSATEDGTFPLLIEITDANGDRLTQSFIVTVLAPDIDIVVSIPPASAGAPFASTVTVTGAAQPVRYTLTGDLPAGLAFDPATGTISGTPTGVGTFPITLTVTDANGYAQSATAEIDISATAALTLSASPTSATFGESVEVEATLTSAASEIAGTVVFVVDGADYASVPVSGGLAQLTLQGLTVGSHTIAARFEPAPGFRAAEADLAGGLNIVAAPTSLSIVSDGTAVVGTPVSFSIAVTSPAGTPGGEVIPVIDGIEQTAVPVTNGEASFTYTFATLGNHTVGARYPGSESFAASTEVLAGGITLGGVVSTVTVSAEPTEPTYGQSVVITASVTSGFGTPTGLVVFTRDGVELGSVPLNGGVASLTLSGLAPGSGTITTTYQGDAGHEGANGTLSITLADAATSLQLAASPTTLYEGAPVTFTAAISSAAGQPGGSIVFVIGGTEYRGEISGGNTTLTLSDLPTGTYSAAARFEGQPGFASSQATLASDIVIAPAPTDIEVQAQTPRSVAGEALSVAIAATGGVSPYSYAVTAGVLPDGVNLDTQTGAITGTPSTPGSYNFTVTVSGEAGAPGSVTLNLVVLEPAELVIPDAIAPAVFGNPINVSLAASGGTEPYTYASTGTLPSGVTFDPANGALSGTPSALGTYEFSLTVTDANGFTATRSYSLSVTPPTIALTPDFPPGGAFVPYSGGVTVSGGSEPYTFTITDGVLPDGLALDPQSGAIAGTPRVVGDSGFTLTARDANGFVASTPITLSIVQAFTVVLPDAIADGRQLRPYAQSLAASGGTAPYAYDISAGALPAGLSLDGTTGAITGTPTAWGDFAFTLNATDANGVAGTRAYTLSINAAATLVPDMTFEQPVAGVPYNQALSISGGTGPYGFTLVSGTLPPDLIFDAATGTISGTATQAGTFPLVIEIRDANGDSITQSYRVIVAAPEIDVSIAMPQAQAGEPFNSTVTVTGGAAPLTFTLAGTLPEGLTFDPATGAISGTPTEAGTFPITITATDANGFAQSAGTTIAVAEIPPPVRIELGDIALTSVRGEDYSATITVDGGTAPYRFTIASGRLPAGLVLDEISGTLSGQATEIGTFGFVVAAEDSGGNRGERSFALTVEPPAFAPQFPSAIPSATGSTYYEASVAVTGPAPLTYAVSQGSLPTGLALDSATGLISGTPTASGDFAFDITVTNGLGQTASTSLAVTVSPPQLGAGGSLPAATGGTPYDAQLSISGGAEPYSFTLISARPDGLVFDSASGRLSGTPTVAGTFPISVDVADANGFVSQITFQLAIAIPSLSIDGTPPPARVGSNFTFTPTVNGGTPDYSFSILSGNLPAGLVLDPATGGITGTPTLATTTSFTLVATDANGFSVNRSFTVDVATNQGTAQMPGSLADGQVGLVYNGSAASTGGTSPLSYSVTQGSLPPGLTLNTASGALEGTPERAGTYLFTITVTDGDGRVNSGQYTVSMAPPALEISGDFPQGLLGQNYRDGITVSGGIGPYTFALSNAPRDLTIDSRTGVISGIPRQQGTFDIVVSVTDAAGHSLQLAGSITVQHQPVALLLRDITEGTTGTAYSSSVAATNGVGPITYALIAGSLPDGIVLDTSSGELSGIPLQVEDADFTIQATDADGDVGTRRYTLTIIAGQVSDTDADIQVELSAPTVGIGGNVRFEITVSTTSGPVTNGAVSLIDAETGETIDSTVLGNAGTAVFSLTADAAGERTFLVRFSGAPGVSPGDSAPVVLSTEPVATLTTLTAQPPAPAAGEEVELTATVERVTGGAPGDGNVIFFVDGEEIATVPVANGIAVTSTILPTGTVSVSAQFESTTGNDLPSSASLSITTAGEAQISLSGPQGQVEAGTSLTYTAQVTPTSAGGPAPTGTVSFSVDGSEVASASLSNGTASATLDGLTTGNHQITAVYSGDAVYEAATSNSLSVSVAVPAAQPLPTTTALTPSTGTPVVGDPVTLTATVTGGQQTRPSGLVRFIDQTTGTGIGTGTLNGQGQATLLHRFTSTDAKTISADYQGDDLNLASSDQILFNVVPSPTQISLQTSADVVGANESAVLTAEFSRMPDGRGPPRVEVIEFKADDVVFASVPVDGATTVTVETPPIDMTVEFTASLIPEAIDRTDMPSTSNAVIVGLSSALEPTTTDLSIAPNPSVQGSAVTLSALVTAATGTVDGAVRFSQNGTVLGTVTLVGGTASLTLSTLPLGNSVIDAEYLGDVTFAPSSDTETASVTPPPGVATLTITGQASPTVIVAAGQPVTLTFQVGAVGNPVSDIVLSVPGASSIACPQTTLASGASMACTATYVATQTDISTETTVISATVSGTGAAPASTTVTLTSRANEVSETFEKLTNQFIATRARMVTGIALPDIFDRRIAAGGNRPGSLNVQTDNMSETYQFATSLEQLRGFAANPPGDGPRVDLPPLPVNIWVDARLALHGTEGEDLQWSRLGVAAAGVDVLVNDDVLVGIAAQMDWMTDQTEQSTFTGTGYLIGPYASIALSDNLSLDLALFYGKSTNRGVSSIGGITYAGDFETDRLLATAGLGGYFEFDEFIVRPSATLFLSSESAESYFVSDADGNSVSIPPQDILDLQLRGGLTIERAIELDNGATLTPMVGLNLTYGGALNGSGFQDRITGGVMGGLLYNSGNFSVKGSVEAEFGIDGFEGATGRLSITGKF
ncbi:putative Ig domain-containing protein [Devosia riboflavina]